MAARYNHLNFVDTSSLIRKLYWLVLLELEQTFGIEEVSEC